MVEMLHVISDENVGHDEASVQSLLKKHQEICNEIDQYESQIHDVLCGELFQKLCVADREKPEVKERIEQVEKRYEDLRELAKIRKQRLLDAAALYRLFREAEAVEAWITEKEKLLVSIVSFYINNLEMFWSLNFFIS